MVTMPLADTAPVATQPPVPTTVAPTVAPTSTAATTVAANAATTSVVTAAVLVVVHVTRWDIDNETLGLLLLVAHAAAHAALPLVKALYGRALAAVQPK